MLQISEVARQWIAHQATTNPRFIVLLTAVESAAEAYESVELVVERDTIAVKVADHIAKKPFSVDFSIYRHRLHRIQHNQWEGEFLLQLIGKQERYQIVDATAGFGRDSFLLAAAGHRIIAHEANPLIALLLYAGLSKHYADDRVNKACQHITLVASHAQDSELLSIVNETVDETTICYLDPMFHTDKTLSLKNEKFAQVLQALTVNFSSIKTALPDLLEWAHSLPFLSVIVKQSTYDDISAEILLKQLNKRYFLQKTKRGKGFTLSSYSVL